MEDYKEKYEMALERAKKNYDAAQDLCNGSQIGVECFKNTLTNIFPELKESEDEKIRKFIIEQLFKIRKTIVYNSNLDRELVNALAWLEKQGVQKVSVADFKAKDWYVSKVDGKIHDMTYNPTDKVEPKFKIGDWIVNDYCMGRVVELTNDAYLLDTEQGIPFSYEHNVHLWTIEDAKDGDVLVDKYGNIGIYQGDKNAVRWNSYCYCGVNKGFYDGGSHEFPCYPATKEQRDLLFQKMKEAGYTFDFEKKELKKPQRMISAEAKEALYDKVVEPKFKNGQWIVWQDKCYKVNYNGCGYELVDQNGLSTSLEYGTIDENAHLWDITKDAKDGDVVVNSSNIFVFHFTNETRLMGYCHVNVDDMQFYNDIGKNECFCLIDAEVSPATKEQRELLFQKMKEAGYQWDAEKRELKLLITNGGDFEPKQEWSEEDDYNLQCVIAKVTSDIQKGNVGRNNELIDWLKSLKDKIKA